MGSGQPVSTYAGYLPAILQRPFLQQFLLAFEAVLSGGVDPPANGAAAPPARGIEQIIAGISAYFDPVTSPAEFLPWLAQWAATSLRNDWSLATQRAFLGQVVPLYQERGTLAGLVKVLELSSDQATIEDLTFSTGADMPANYFQVTVAVQENDPDLLARKTREIRAIIDREKPAHTYYGLVIAYPSMRINDDPADPSLGPGILLGVWEDNGQTVVGTSVLGTTNAQI
jgi:phage tail P2-like protein